MFPDKNIDIVGASVEDKPNLLIRRRAQQLRLSLSTVWKILGKDLGCKAYKIQLVQELKNDHPFTETLRFIANLCFGCMASSMNKIVAFGVKTIYIIGTRDTIIY